MEDKIKVKIESWSKVYKELPINNDNIGFFKLLNTIYKRLDIAEQFVYFVDYEFGDRIIKNGKIRIDDFKLTNPDNIFNRNNENFKEDINYSSDPLGIITKNEAWIVSSDDKVRLGKLEEGQLFGVFGTLDFLNFEKSDLYGNKDWSLISGDCSFHLFFNFALNEVEERFREIYLRKEGDTLIKRSGKYIYDDDKTILQKNIEFVKLLNKESSKTRVIYLPKHILNFNRKDLKNEDTSILKAINYIYQKGWEQSKPIRSSLFEDDNLNKSIKKISFLYKEDYLIPLYVYCYHVANGEKEAMSPLIDSDINELGYIEQFKKLNSNVYFNREKDFLPVIFKYKKLLNKKDFGVISTKHLPIPGIPQDFFKKKFPDIINDIEKIKSELNHSFQISYYNTQPSSKCQKLQNHQAFIKFISERSDSGNFNFNIKEHNQLIIVESCSDKVFPEYYVLTELMKELEQPDVDYNNYHIISVQHLLRSTGSLFEALIDIGFNPKNIYLTGKIYSTHKETKELLKNDLGINIIESTIKEDLGQYSQGLKEDINQMWRLLLENTQDISKSKIIILDDGGHILKSVDKELLKKYNIYGIEQTTSGIKEAGSFENFPIIDVAGSAAKVLIEPNLVSEAVNIQLHDQFINFQKNKIGIIGYGHIGKAIAKEYEEKGYQIFVFDNKKKIKESNTNITVCENSWELYLNSEIIIGATGDDITDNRWITQSNEDKIFMSVSSGDIEFNKLIQNSRFTDLNSEENLKKPIPLRIKQLNTDTGHKLIMLRGGMVSNFTGSADSSPGKYIQITRGLLFSAIIQILKNEDNLKKEVLKLDAQLQKKVVEDWFKDQPQRRIEYSSEVLSVFEKINLINKKSGGTL